MKNRINADIEGIIELFGSMDKMRNQLDIPKATISFWKKKGEISIARAESLSFKLSGLGIDPQKYGLPVNHNEPKTANQQVG